MKISTRIALLSFVLSCLSAAGRAADAPKTIAKIGESVLTEEQMRKEMGMQLYQAENQLYMVQKNWLDQKAQEVLFSQAAKAAGLSRQAWEAREIDGKIAPPDDNQIKQVAGQFARPGVSSTETLKMAAEAIANQSRQGRRMQLYQELAAKTPIEIMIFKPEAPRINVTYAADDPIKGNSNAPVTIVEFTDFQCPYCKRAQDTLKQVEAAYPKDVKIVARQYPLPFHDRAKPAAEAAHCAREQGKYWPYRDKLFDKQELSDADLQRYAKEVGLNMKKFQACVSEHRYASRIANDIAEGQKFGVNGTPAFFVNGELISGAQPFANFQQAVQSALAKKK